MYKIVHDGVYLLRLTQYIAKLCWFYLVPNNLSPASPRPGRI